MHAYKLGTKKYVIARMSLVQKSSAASSVTPPRPVAKHVYTIPKGALVFALEVSSAIWADAS